MKSFVFLLLPLLALMVTSASAQTLRGSRASVERIHRQALQHDLHFYMSGSGVRRAAAAGTLVRLSTNRDYLVDGAAYPYALPATQTFVARLAAQYRAACGQRLVVTSALRPTAVRLANGSDQTVHPTGMAIDLRKPTKRSCLVWLRNTLLALEGEGVLDAVEEYRPPHFHVAVFPTQYRRYVQGRGGAGDVQLAAEPQRAPSGSGSARAAQAAGTRYRVRRGDTLWTIARRHGVSVERLKSANDIRSSRIAAGQTLVIPRSR